MLEDLLAIANLIERDEESGFAWLTHTDWQEGVVTLSLDIQTVRYPIHPHWQVTCSGVREHSLSFGLAENLLWSDEHPLLWAHTKRKLSFYFSGSCESPGEIIGALYTRHWELTQGWLPFHRFLNPHVRISQLLTGGSGMLAEGPEPLLLAYEEVLKRFGLTTSHVDAGEPAYWDGETWQEQREKLSVLILGPSYIVAETFSATKVDE